MYYTNPNTTKFQQEVQINKTKQAAKPKPRNAQPTKHNPRTDRNKAKQQTNKKPRTPPNQRKTPKVPKSQEIPPYTKFKPITKLPTQQNHQTHTQTHTTRIQSINQNKSGKTQNANLQMRNSTPNHST